MLQEESAILGENFP